MAVNNKAAQTSENNTNLADNTTGAITPALLRTVVNDMVAAYQQTPQVNAQVGTTYTFVVADYGQLVTFSNASPIAVTLPQAISTFAVWNVFVKNLGAGLVTITPTTSTINGAATLVLGQNQSAFIVSDGTNYQAFLAGDGAVASVTSPLVLSNGALSLNTIPINKGGTAQTTAAAARASSGLNVDNFTGHGDSIYTILATDKVVGTNAAFTASRTWTLPAANAVNPGQPLIVADFQGTVTNVNTLIIARAGADTINGGTSVTINAANGAYFLVSDGVSKWTAQAIGAAAVSGVTSIGGLSGVVGLGTGLTTSGANVQLSITPVVSVKVQTFSASGTYTPSTGMLYCIIECWGGGGGGGGALGAGTITNAAGGGGAGSKSVKYSTAAAVGASKTVTIGAGGGGGTGSGNGSAGLDTSVGTLCIGKGGSGGFAANGVAAIPAGGAGGVAGTGDITGVGQPGGAGGLGTNSSFLHSGPGGSTEFGGGGASVIAASGNIAGGNAGTQFGAGGSGAATNNTGAGPSGGSGANGFVRITEFCSQ